MTNKYPSDEELLSLASQHRSMVALAQTLGLSRSTLREHIQRRGLKEQISERMGQFVGNQWTPPSATSQDEQRSLLEKELEALRQEAKELRSHLAVQTKEDIRELRITRALEEAVEAKSVRFQPRKITRSEKKQAHTLCLLWSDLHAAEVVSADETNGANEYNWKVMLKRHDELRRGVLSFAERFGPIEELVILGLGDMLSGSIHPELAETNEMPMAEASIQMGLDGAEFIESFTEEFPVRFAGVTGNHGRFTQKPRSKGRYDNADWIAYQVMSQRLAKNPHVSVDVPRPQRHIVEIYDKKILMLHGDGIRSTMVGVPWGGIIRFCNQLSNQYTAMGHDIDHFCMGHFHEANAVSNRKILVNGSVKGVDEYSLDRYGAGHNAAQLLVPFHPKWGLVGVHFIDLQEENRAT